MHIGVAGGNRTRLTLGHNQDIIRQCFGHTYVRSKSGRDSQDRTDDRSAPDGVRYQAALYPETGRPYGIRTHACLDQSQMR